MTSIALGLFILFIVYVIVWSIKNDGAKSIGHQTGIIKMRDPTVGGKPNGRSSHRRQIVGDIFRARDPH
jgi:hypothetical protein